MMKFKKWLIGLFVSSIIWLVMIVSLCYYIDPYGLYHSNFLNKPRIMQEKKMRLIKVLKIKELKPSSIILGTSRAEGGFDPNHDYFLKPSYNLATSSSTMYENKLLLKLALSQNNLKQLLLVVDNIMFNSPKQKQLEDFETYFQDINKYKLLFSLDTLTDSIKTIIGTQSPVTLYYDNGQRLHNYADINVKIENGHYNMFSKSEKDYYKGYSKNYTYGDTGNNSFNDFEEFLELCYESNIQTDIIFGPSHIRQWEVFDYFLGYEKFLKWKKDIVISVNKVGKKYNKRIFRVIDFSVYHPLTNEAIPYKENISMRYHWESSHYKNGLGLIVLDRLSGRNMYNDFGYELTLDNIDAYLENQKLDRLRYVNIDKIKQELIGK